MDIQLENLFPVTLKKDAIEIFGEEAIYPVLLLLLEAPLKDQGSKTTGPQFYTLLHTNETDLYNGYSFVKRRSEYLTGRICAKLAIQGYLSDLNRTQTALKAAELRAIEIANSKTGRPSPLFHDGSGTVDLDISISHSGDYGLALVTRQKCGIDIQLQQESLLRVREKYCSENEYRLLESRLDTINPLHRLGLLWASKEAAKKALSVRRMPGFNELTLIRMKENQKDSFTFSFRLEDNRQTGMPNTVTVVAGLFEKYSLAICLLSED